ncbi:MAG: glycosyltransferase [Candidatus Diapherotrites archaeon]|nr:glycosyltransferase [Candidatus Diapherotrites archaeon]
MNILYIAEDISLPGFHGGSTHVQETINSLKELGHKVFVLCKNDGKQPIKEEIRSVKYVRIKLPKSSLKKNLFLFNNLKKEVKRVFTEENIDLIWQRNRIFGNQGIIIGKKLGARTIIEMNEPIESSENSIFFHLIKKWFFYTIKYADIVTGTHKCMFNKIPKEKQLLTWHGSNPKLFNPKKPNQKVVKKYNLKGKTIFYSGSFQKWHCLKNALLAFKKINEYYPEAVFLLAGEGDKKKELESFSSQEKIPQVYFLGKVPFEELSDYINSSEACIALFDRNYPAIKKYEYYYSPIKVFDAMACGKPIIASNIGNLKEIVKEDKNGFLVNEESTEEILTAYKKALVKTANINLIKKNNLNLIKKKYNWMFITKRILMAVSK